MTGTKHLHLSSVRQTGYWSVDVSDAEIGDEYRYLIHGPEGSSSRIDPYARKVTHATGTGIIYNPDAFDWGGGDTVNIAAWNELIIYEMHVGTFYVKKKGIPVRWIALSKKCLTLKNWVSMPLK